MLGVMVNAVAVVIGSAIGLLFKKGIPERFTGAIMTAVGLCVTYIGISGALKGENAIVLIVSMVLGTVAGTAMDIDGFIVSLGERIERRTKRVGGSASVSEGFVTASLLFCVGAMTVVGSINAGLGDHEMLFTKSVLDFISSIMLTVSLGIGVMFASVFVLVFQGSIALLAGVIAPYLSEGSINELVCAGSVMIIALGLNMIGVAKIKVANFIPALIFAPVIAMIAEKIMGV